MAQFSNGRASWINLRIMKSFISKGVLVFAMMLIVCHGNGQMAAASNTFAVRAFHLDLRIQVMTMPALKKLAVQLHDEKFNTLIMEYEATYPFEKHPLISNRYAYTPADIKTFIPFCKQLGIDVIPLQQSFGHVEYILRNQRYASLREDEKDLSQVCPLQAMGDSLLFHDLYAELAATHPSKYIHIGGDETYLLGHCPLCRAKVEKEGVAKLYTDYISMLCHIVIGLGKIPVLWADIALKYPESLKSLPKETVFVDWNYGWDNNRFGDHDQLINSGFEIWGAPSLRSHPDNYFITQWQKHFNNLRDFVPYARNSGYKGIVLTSWSTSGAYSYLYDAEGAPAELYAIRHVYPLTGFNILIKAFAESMQQNNPLNVDDFILQYATNQYGLDQHASRLFEQALFTAPYEIKNNVVESKSSMSLDALADSLSWASSTFHKLMPSRNKEEFAHYTLMADIRLQYVRVVQLENRINAPEFTRSKMSDLHKELMKLAEQSKQLNAEFIKLNKDSYFSAALADENEIRDKRLQIALNKSAAASSHGAMH